MCRKTCCFSVLSSKRAGEHVLSLGQKIGWVRRIGHVESYRFASRNSSARAVFERARPRDAVSSVSSVGIAYRRARPAPTQPRPKDWLGSPDQTHQNLSILVEKLPCAPWFRAGAHDNCGCGEACSGHTIPAAAHTQRGSGGPSARQPARRPPARLPSCRPPDRTTRAHAPLASLLRARACCTARCTARWTTLVCRFVCRLQERTPAHGWRASPTAPSAHCRAWACAPWPAPPSPALPDPPRWCPAPPRLASLGRARPAPTCPAPLVPPRPTRPGPGQPRPAPRALQRHAAPARVGGPGGAAAGGRGGARGTARSGPGGAAWRGSGPGGVAWRWAPPRSAERGPPPSQPARPRLS